MRTPIGTPVADELPVWLRRSDDGWMLAIHVQPNAASTAVVGPHGDALKIRLAAPPVDGKANAVLLRFLADCLGQPLRALELCQGQSGRAKRIALRGSQLGAQQVIAALAYADENGAKKKAR